MILAYGLIFTGFGLLLAGLFLFLKWDAYNLILFSLGIQTKRQKELQEKIYKAKTSETSTSITSVTSTGARVSGVHPSDLEQAKPQFASVVSSKNANLKDNRLDIIARGENNIDEATLFEGELEEDSYTESTESTESSVTGGSSGSFNLDLGYTVNENLEEAKTSSVGGYSLQGLRSAGSDEYTDNVADDLTQVLVEDDLTQVLVEDELVEKPNVEIVMGDGESFALGGYAANKERLKKRKKKNRVSEPAPKVEDFIKGYRQSVSGSSEKQNIPVEDNDLTEVLVEDNDVMDVSDLTEIIVDEGLDPNEAFTELTDSVMQEYMVNGDYGAELGRTSQEVENNDGYVPLKIRDTKPIEPEVSVTEVTEFFLDDEATEYEGTEFEDEDELTGRLDDDFEEELTGIRVLTEIVNTANIEDIKGEV